MTRLECLKRAAEADQLVAVLSLNDDKVRFRDEAEYWRGRADLEEELSPPPQKPPGWRWHAPIAFW